MQIPPAQMLHYKDNCLTNRNLVMIQKLSTEQVFPGGRSWKNFLNMTYIYFNENGPKKVTGQSLENFYSSYWDILLERYNTSVRGLFLYYIGSDGVGLSNSYLDGNAIKRLNIAEFYVVPDFRKKGIGTEILCQIINWGKIEEATIICVEVDKSLLDANKFWSTFNFKLTKLRNRNLYTQDI